MVGRVHVQCSSPPAASGLVSALSLTTMWVESGHLPSITWDVTYFLHMQQQLDCGLQVYQKLVGVLLTQLKCFRR